MVISFRNKNLFNLISLICIVGFVGSSFAASTGTPQIIPDGKVLVFSGDQKIAVLTAESPLPVGKMLRVEGKCGIKMDSLYLVATNSSALIVRMENRGQEILVKEGKIFFGITAMPGPISFFTPKGGVVAQQVMLKTSSQSSMLEGYIDVSKNVAEIGVTSGGAMIISTADGVKTIKEGERFLLAQAKVPVATKSAAAAVTATAGGLSGGTIAAILGGAIAMPLIGGASALNNNNASPK